MFLMEKRTPKVVAIFLRELVGPLATLFFIILVQLLRMHCIVFIPNPPAVLTIFIVLSAYLGGLRPGLISGACSLGYFAYFFSDPPGAFQFTVENLARVTVWMITIPILILIVGILQRRNVKRATEIKEQIKQLEASNAALEAFGYSISHDLRSPLRRIKGFSTMLIEDFEGQLGEEGKKLLRFVFQNTEKMDLMIDNLFLFSRVTRGDIKLAALDLKEIALSVFEEMKKGNQTPSVEVRIGDLPRAVGDRAMIYQVFFNLVDNAFKFSARQRSPVIEIGSLPAKGEIICFVRDNGAGFDMAYAERLFGVFQRLHSDSEFPGTGVGLAIVQSIILRHGGRVWAEGASEHGACFFFSIPMLENLSFDETASS